MLPSFTMKSMLDTVVEYQIKELLRMLRFHSFAVLSS